MKTKIEQNNNNKKRISQTFAMTNSADTADHENALQPMSRTAAQSNLLDDTNTLGLEIKNVSKCQGS